MIKWRALYPSFAWLSVLLIIFLAGRMAVAVMAILIQGQLEYTLRLTMVSQMVWLYIGVIGAISASQSSSPTMRST